MTRLAGGWSKPAISWPFLVAVLAQGTRKRVIGIDLRDGQADVPRRDRNGDDLGRPSIDRSLVVWHKTTRTSSRILIGDVRTGRVSTVRASRRLLLSNPSLRGGVLIWSSSTSASPGCKERRITAEPPHAARGCSVSTPRLFWTTAVARRGVFVTRWNTNNSHAFIQRVAR